MGWQGLIDTGGEVRVPLPRRRSRSSLPPPAGVRLPWRRWSTGLTPARLAIVALLLAILVLSHGAWRAISEHPATVPLPPPPPTAGYESEDHFPGAQLFYVSDAEAAPTTGVTGTTQLPDLPIPPDAAAPLGDGSAEPGGLAGTIFPAQPFSMAAASATDRARALQCLTAAIYYEAASEPDAGQQAVAQVILNRVRHPAFPNSVCGVVYQGSERATGCQFSFACDGSMARVPSRFYWDRAMRVAAAALAGRVMPAVGLATHYHTYAVTPAWNRQLVMTAAIGAHFFHRWRGWWGTPAAFRQAYVGGEPEPGPHRAIIAPVTPLPAGAPARPTTAAQVIQPDYQTSGLPVGTPASSVGAEPAARPAPAQRNTGTDESQILPQWRDSGRPLD